MSKYKLLEVYGKRIRTLSGILSVLLFALLITPVLFESASEYAVADMPLGGSGSGPGGADSMIDGGPPDPSSGSSDSSDSSGDADGSTGGNPTSGGDGLTSGDSSGDGSTTSGESSGGDATSGGDGSGSGDASSGDGSTTTGGESATGGDNSSSGGDGSSTGGDTSSGGDGSDAGDDDESSEEGSDDNMNDALDGTPCTPLEKAHDDLQFSLTRDIDGQIVATSSSVCIPSALTFLSKSESKAICRNEKVGKKFTKAKRRFKSAKQEGDETKLAKAKKQKNKWKRKLKECIDLNNNPVRVNFAAMEQSSGEIILNSCGWADSSRGVSCKFKKDLKPGQNYNIGSWWIVLDGKQAIEGPLSPLQSIIAP